MHLPCCIDMLKILTHIRSQNVSNHLFILCYDYARSIDTGPMLLRCVALQKTEAVAVNSGGPGSASRSAASTATNTIAPLGNVASSASASSSKVPRAQIKVGLPADFCSSILALCAQSS